MITIAQWDTDNFGIKVGNLIFEDAITADTISQVREEALKEDYDLLYIKGVDIPTELLDENLFLADEKVIYAQKTEGAPKVSEAVSVLHNAMSNDLLELAYESGKYSRYKLDKKLPPHIFTTLYRQWMLRSLNGDIADDVLAIQVENTNLGMLTYKQADGIYDIGLVAVSQEYAGNGVGSKLMQSFLSKVGANAEVEVATQKINTVACHFYEKNNFKIKSITKIYHLWVK